MPKPKALIILAGIIAALAISATTASAEFSGTLLPAQTQGEVAVSTVGEFRDEGVSVFCPKEDIKAQWHIQAKGQIKTQQNAVTKGPHLNIQFKSWAKNEGTKKCFAKVSLGEVATEVKPCDLQLVQRQKEGKVEASVGVSEACLIKIGTICELQIPVGMETAANTDQGINVGLTRATLHKEENPFILKALFSVVGGGVGQTGGKIFVVVVSGHPLCPIKTNERGELLEFELELKSLTA